MDTGSSHELAANLLTEAILYATATLGIALWVLLLDKKSAFDSILKEHVVCAAFAAAQHQGDHSLLYLANRLSSRLTYLEQDKVMMGPIPDRVGVEQGGVASSDLFQLVNNNELVVKNSSGLGLDMGAVSIAAIGQADDVALLSPHPIALQSLLNLSQDFSTATSLQNVPEKTKLLVYSPKCDTTTSAYWQEAFPITMNGAPLPLSSQAEHVGVVRSTGSCGNMPAVLARLSSHTKSLHTILSCGMARGHRGNHAASLRVEATYCSPRLYSGLSTLHLSSAEIAAISSQQKTTLEQHQRLYPCTPAPAVHLLSGTIPAQGILHMRQLGLLFMIAKLGPDHILHRHALYTLHHRIATSWFSQVTHWHTLPFLMDTVPLL
jgi:hypothetical protein